MEQKVHTPQKYTKTMIHTGQGGINFSRSGRSRGILIICQICIQLCYGSVLKEDCTNLIDHPILYSEVFIYIHITASYILVFNKIPVVSKLA